MENGKREPKFRGTSDRGAQLGKTKFPSSYVGRRGRSTTEVSELVCEHDTVWSIQAPVITPQDSAYKKINPPKSLGAMLAKVGTRGRPQLANTLAVAC